MAHCGEGGWPTVVRGDGSAWRGGMQGGCKSSAWRGGMQGPTVVGCTKACDHESRVRQRVMQGGCSVCRGHTSYDAGEMLGVQGSHLL